jgi:hypothetical protein
MCFGNFVPKFGSNLIIVLPDMAIRGGETFQFRDSLNIPNDDVAHLAIEQATHSKVHSRCGSERAHLGGSMECYTSVTRCRASLKANTT